MKQLFKIQASIKLNIGGGRTWPIKTGYRPGFNFVAGKQTSGSLNLLKEEKIHPGDEAVVEISFISDELLGNIKEGCAFKFYEGPVEIGTGTVLKIIGWVENF